MQNLKMKTHSCFPQDEFYNFDYPLTFHPAPSSGQHHSFSLLPIPHQLRSHFVFNAN